MSKLDSEKTLFIKGALTNETVMQHWEKIKPALSSCVYEFLDLKDVTQSDSASVALLLAIFRESMHVKCHIQFLNVPDQIIEIAKVNGVIHFLPMSE